VLDACVLVPMPVADTLLRLAEPPGLYEPRWTDEILAEVTRTPIGRFGKAPGKALYRETSMRRFFPDAMVENYQRLVPEMTNHPKDRHVLAAAVASDADYLVTFNLKDFVTPAAAAPKTAVIGPSAFLKQLTIFDRAAVDRRLLEQAAAIDIGLNDLLDRLEGSVPGFISFLREQ
jgi:hypothetical protein